MLIDAIGEINENKVRDAKLFTPKIKKISFKRITAIAATIVLCLTMSVSVLAATVHPVYQMLYQISPSLAQMLKPIQLSCEDKGIKMEVISAAVDENEAVIYISLKDLTDENRIDETTDLFDSYRINRDFDSSASCKKVSFDEETGIATFLINISQFNGQKIEGNKITFYFTEFLSHKNVFPEGEITGINLSTVTEATETYTPNSIRGGSLNLNYRGQAKNKCLIPLEGGITSPVDGVTVSNIGFINNQLHIQVHYENIKDYDDHGFIYMYDEKGNKAESCSLSFFDDKKVRNYDEYVYDITPETISKYKIFGEFVTCRNNTKGLWQVTFSLENT